MADMGHEPIADCVEQDTVYIDTLGGVCESVSDAQQCVKMRKRKIAVGRPAGIGKSACFVTK
jgi:hypothetical protein